MSAAWVFNAKKLFAQQAFSKYHSGSLSLVNISDHLNLEFTWSLKGKVQTFMNEGLNQYADGNTQSAIENFDEVIKQEPEFWPALYYRGVCHKNLREFRQALSDLQWSLRFNPTVAGYLELGELYHVTGAYSEAKKTYMKAIELQSSSAIAHYFVANLYLTAQGIASAEIEYKKSIELDPNLPDAYFALGIIRFNNTSDLQSNLVWFDKAIAADSTFKQALFVRALTYCNYGEYDKGLADWNRLISLQPGNPFFRQMRGFTHIELGNYDDAFNDFKRVVLANRKYDDYYTGEQGLYDRQSDLENGASYLTRKGYGLKEEAFTLVKKGYCLLLAGKYTEAIHSLNQSLEIESSSSAYLLKAMVLNQTRSSDAAMASYSNALQYDNDIFEAHEKRALYFWQKGNYSAAKNDLKEMRRLQPGSTVLDRFSGMLNSKTGNYSECIMDLEKFLKETDDFDAWMTLAVCQSFLNHHQDAVQIYNRLIEAKPANSALYFLLSEQLILSDDTLAAVRTLGRLSSKLPNDNAINIKIANSLLGLSQYDSASIVIDRVMLDLDRRYNAGWTVADLANQSEARLVLCQLALARNEPDEALHLLNSALSFVSLTPDVRFVRMKVNIALNKFNEAKKDYDALKTHSESAKKFYEQSVKNRKR